MFRVLFPPKCILCAKILHKNETDLCHSCRENAETFPGTKTNIPFVAHWTSLWYYKDDVRCSIHRFKFGNQRHYAESYGRLLGLRISDSIYAEADLITWVPVSTIRKLRRGYDQSKLLANALGKELSIPVQKLLKKVRHTPPQSTIGHAPQRRANVLNAYKILNSQQIVGKRILLVDDVVTTGATASECAKMLLTAGAKEVNLATIAVAKHDKK